MPDSHMLWRDTFAALAAIALETSTITLGTSVTNLQSRHPTLVASSARTVAELAPGRFRLGIGSGDSSVILSGQKISKTSELRRGIELISALLRGKSLRVADTESVLHDPGVPIPILMAADGPRNLGLATEVADGVITTSGGIREKLIHVNAGMEAAQRTRPLYHVTTINARVTDDLERDAHELKPMVARYAQKVGGREVLEAAGFPVSVPSGHIPLPDGTDLAHPRDQGVAVAIASQWISDQAAVWYAQNLCLYGTGEEIVAKMNEIYALGIDEIQVSDGGAFDLPLELIDRMGKDVLPSLQG